MAGFTPQFAQRMISWVKDHREYVSGTTYQQTTTTPHTLDAATLYIGANLVGVTAPAGAVTINIPAGTDPLKRVIVADERDEPDQGTITVVSL